MFNAPLDTDVRRRAFAFLEEQTRLHGEAISRTVLQQGFLYKGERVPLISPQGIFKPRLLDLPLTITTVPPTAGKKVPYHDHMSSDGVLTYRYRGTDPNHRDNIGLRTLMQRKIPCIYLYGLVEGWYVAAWPVYLERDYPQSLSFIAQLDDRNIVHMAAEPTMVQDRTILRGYITREFQQRLHQQAFRERVLSAYRDLCAVCRLKHRELLDAAHIIPDKDERGEPVVTNGLAMCKLHHAAFDQMFIGITPGYHIVIPETIRREKDGPMLIHGLQGFHNESIVVPRSAELKPNKKFLEERFEEFLRKSA